MACRGPEGATQRHAFLLALLQPVVGCVRLLPGFRELGLFLLPPHVIPSMLLVGHYNRAQKSNSAQSSHFPDEACGGSTDGKSRRLPTAHLDVPHCL